MSNPTQQPPVSLPKPTLTEAQKQAKRDMLNKIAGKLQSK